MIFGLENVLPARAWGCAGILLHFPSGWEGALSSPESGSTQKSISHAISDGEGRDFCISLRTHAINRSPITVFCHNYMACSDQVIEANEGERVLTVLA